MHLLVGLGNPGTSYAQHRHNIGFRVVDAIAQLYKFPAYASKFRAHIAQGEIAGTKTLLVKPQTYMNLSGEAVGEILRFYKLESQVITVFHDELDLPFMKLRVKIGGGNGGHNGLKSLDAHIGADYQRVRLGIGHPGHKALVSDYVLSDFVPEEKMHLEAWIRAIALHTPLLQHADDGNKFMTAMTPLK